MEENIVKDGTIELLNQLNNVVEALVKNNVSEIEPKDIENLDFTSTKLYGDATQRISFFTDFAKFTGEVSNPKNESNNPFHKSKYSNLSTVLNTIRPTLSKFGFSMSQIPVVSGSKVSINCILMHKSGAFMTFQSLDMTSAKTDPQGIGSTISYLKRYSVGAYLGVAGEDEDNDGNDACDLQQKQETPKQSIPPKQSSPPQTSTKPMSLAQLKVKCTTDAKALFTSKGDENVKALISKTLDGVSIAETTEENKGKLVTLIDELKKM